MLDLVMLTIPLVLFAILVIMFIALLRRAGRVTAATRELDVFSATVQDLSTRSVQSLSSIADRVDSVRRGAVAPDTISDALDDAVEAIANHRAEAEAMAIPAGFSLIQVRLLHELERADRALEMVGHGCHALEGTAGRPRQDEGQTAVKRGYLNLLHAREAIVDVAADLRARPPSPDGRRYFSDRPRLD